MTVLLLCHGAHRRARRWTAKYHHWFAQQGREVRAFYTTNDSSQDAEQLQPVVAQVTEIVVLAGDGTLHWLINTLSADQLQGVAISVIPLGTGNDFARDLGVTDKRWRMQRSERFQRHSVTLGQWGDHLFINAASSGLTAELIATQSLLTKRLFGRFSYLLGVLRWWWRFRPARDNQQPVLRSYLAGRYLGGGIALAPHAERTSTQLTAVTIKQASRWQLLGVLWAVLRQTHTNGDKPHPLVEVNKVTESRLTDKLIEMDGEGYRLTANNQPQDRIRVRPNYLTVLTPKVSKGE